MTAVRPRLALLAVLAVLLPAAGALASGKDVIRDCTDDEVMSRTYTQKDYRAALQELAEVPSYLRGRARRLAEERAREDGSAEVTRKVFLESRP